MKNLHYREVFTLPILVRPPNKYRIKAGSGATITLALIPSLHEMIPRPGSRSASRKHKFCHVSFRLSYRFHELQSTHDERSNATYRRANRERLFCKRLRGFSRDLSCAPVLRSTHARPRIGNCEGDTQVSLPKLDSFARFLRSVS